MKNSTLRAMLKVSFAALVLGSSFLSLEASAAPASHPGFGRSRSAESIRPNSEGGMGREARSGRKGLRARTALPLPSSGKRVRVCKESFSEFTCTTQTVY